MTQSPARSPDLNIFENIWDDLGNATTNAKHKKIYSSNVHSVGKY